VVIAVALSSLVVVVEADHSTAHCGLSNFLKLEGAEKNRRDLRRDGSLR
jgi:hypothetical protein